MLGARVPYDRPIVRRYLISLVFIVLVAVGLSGCETAVTPGAAKIGSQTISSATLTDALHAIASNKGYLCSVAQSNPSAAVRVTGAGSGTYDAAFAASQLTLMIQEQVLSNLLQSLSISARPAQISLATSRLTLEFNPPAQSTCTVSGADILASFPSSYRNLTVTVEVEQELLAAHLAGFTMSASGLAAYATAHRSSAYDACVSDILVATEATATADRAKIESGSSFGSVAKASSTDQNTASSGGVIGCVPLADFSGTLPDDLAKLALNQVSQPISYSGSYLLLEVTSRQAPTELEALNYLVNATATKENVALSAAAAKLKVSIDPQYGRWEKVNGTFEVVPPSGPAVGDLVNSASVTPPTIPLG